MGSTAIAVVPSKPFRGERKQVETSFQSVAPNLSILTSTYRGSHKIGSTRRYPMAGRRKEKKINLK
jgi:hypothetical protein